MTTKTEIQEMLSDVAKKDVQDLNDFWIGLSAYMGISVFNAVYLKNDYLLHGSTALVIVVGFAYGYRKAKLASHYFRFMRLVRNLDDFNFLEDLKMRAMDYDNEFEMQLVRYWVAKTIAQGGFENE